MSENLSIEEIIKRAEKIKAEAERHLQEAEKSLDEKAKTAVQEVVVDENAVVEKIAKTYERIKHEDEDVKEYIPGRRHGDSPFLKAQKIQDNNDDGDVKVVKELAGTEKPVYNDGKTREVELPDDRDVKLVEKEQTSVVPDIKKSKLSLFKRDKAENSSATKRIFVSKPNKDEKSDLEGIPTIVAKEQVFDDENDFEEELGVQIKLDGFDDKIETVPTIDENVAEKILEKRRSEKVGKFRLFGPDETDKELGDRDVVSVDYVSKNEKASFIESLLSKKSAIQIKLILTIILGIPLILITIFKDSAYFPAALSSHTAYFVTALVLYVVVIAVNFNVIIHGFNLKKSINSDFPVSIVSIIILVHTIVLMVNRNLWIDNGVLLDSVGVLAIFMSQLGKRQMMIRIIDNFDFITNSGDTYTVEDIANAVDAEIISRGLIDEEENPFIKTSVKSDFPTNFLEISCKNEPADKVSKILFGMMLLLSIILFVAVGIIDNFNSAFNAALCALSISLPVASLFLTNLMLTDVSYALDKFGSRVCGCEGALMADSTNAMVLEAADLFGKDSCDIHGIKTFNGAKVDDAIIQAAAVMIQTKSPLAHAFDDVIIGKQSILPQVEGVTYEDKMGTSAWIYRRKVLVGNRDLLINHGVSVPKESFEERYTLKGRKALYLAVGGKIIAMFVVSYSADADLKRELKKLEKSGITVIVKSSDPYINEESIADLFSLPQGFVRVMNYSAARVYDKYSGMTVEKSPAYVVHNGSALGFVSAMRGAGIIVSSKNLISFLLYFGSAIGFAVISMLSVLGAYNQLSAFSIIIFQLVWSVFIAAISKLRGLNL
ncbi:MAG: hypothetical protein ACLUFN_06970 [Eubacterium sp.]